MFHFRCQSDRNTFASLVEVCSLAGVSEALPALRTLGVKSAWSLQEWPRSELKAAVGDVSLDKLMCATGPVHKPTRWDIPVVQPYVQRTGVAAESPRNGSLVDLARQTKSFPREVREVFSGPT